MLDRDVVNLTISAVNRLGSSAATPDEAWVVPWTPAKDPTINQLVLFLKPEVTAHGVRLERVLDILRALLSAHTVEIGAVRVMTGAYLERAELMRQHYGVINTVSRLGSGAISDQAWKALRERFGETPLDVLGGHQLLDEYSELSSYGLHLLFSNLGNVKLAPGTYACTLSLDGREVVLLNGFHPYQLERFTRRESVTVLLEGRTTTSWHRLRQDLAGATNPQAAAAGSFRRVLLEHADELGVAHVSQNYNGLHVSAGPLEGMVELQRFFGDITASETCFGRLLEEAGLAPDKISHLATNPVLMVNGRSVPAFDLTEEMNAVPAARALRSAMPGQ